jgi:hypothetical protein
MILLNMAMDFVPVYWVLSAGMGDDRLMVLMRKNNSLFVFYLQDWPGLELLS